MNLERIEGMAESMMEDEVRYHTSRVMAELDLASRAVDGAAADPHLRQSAMHLERMRELSGRLRPPKNRP
jgi:hypothetical protein